MLTKTLLKYSVRKKQIYPRFLDVKKASLQAEATKLISLYEGSKGESLSQLQDKISPFISKTAGGVTEGLNKLLSDRVSSSLEGRAEDFIENRWHTVLEAQKLRQETVFESQAASYSNTSLTVRQRLTQSWYTVMVL